MFGAFGNTGQICMHIERMYLPGVEVRRDQGAGSSRRPRRSTLGASYDFGPDVGSLVSPDHKDRVQSHVEDAVAKGATVLTGGRARPDLGPAFFEPTILEGVTKDMLAGVTETFGPVVALHTYSHRRRGRRARQRHRLRPQRLGLGRRRRERLPGRPADRVGQRQRQRHPRHGVRLQGHAVRRREAVRRRRPPRRPGAAEVHRRAEPRGAQEAGDGRAARARTTTSTSRGCSAGCKMMRKTRIR